MKKLLLISILITLFGHFIRAQSEIKIEQIQLQKYLDSIKAPPRILATPNIISGGSGSNLRVAATTAAAVADPSSTQTSANPIVVFPSPNASTIINKSLESVDLYTGKLSVSIPLYELKSKELSVPIGVSYIGTGGNVNALGGPLGMTFALEATGVISRVMKGLPDEHVGSVTPLLYNFKAYGYLNIKNRNSGDISKWDTYTQAQKLHLIRMGYWQGSDGTDTGQGFPEAYDSQPDEFYYNFGGGKYSGKFVFDQDGNIHTIPAQNFKISKTIATIGNIPVITKFEITTDDGYKYTFGKDNLEGIEQSQLVTTSLKSNFKYGFAMAGLYNNGSPAYLYSRTPILNTVQIGNKLEYDIFNVNNNTSYTNYYYYNSSWYLTHVLAPSGDAMSYGYESVDEVSYIADKSYSVSVPALLEDEFLNLDDNKKYWFFHSSTPPQSLRFPHLQTLTFSVNEVYLKGKRLFSIKGNNGNTAYFDHLTDRKDLIGDKRLDKIRIVIDNKTVKTFTFRYDSTVANKDVEVIDLAPDNETDQKPLLDTDFNFMTEKYKKLENPKPDANTYAEKYIKIFASEHFRFYLKEIKEYGLENKFVGSYLMTYYYPEKLPRRFSYKQDLCGFLNNNKSGTNIPYITYNTENNSQYWVPRSGYGLFGWDNNNSAEPSYHGASPENRAANATLCQSGALKILVFPIQGSKLFKYELNKLTGEAPTSGLRVKEIITYPSIFDTTNFIREKYSYSNPSEVTKRWYSYSLPLTNFIKLINVNSKPYNPQYTTKGGIVGYKEVTVSQTNNGKTVYTFLNPQDIPNMLPIVTLVTGQTNILDSGLPFSDETDNDWKRGLIKRIQIYDNNNKLIKKSFNDYELNADGNNAKTIYALLPTVYMDGSTNSRASKAGRYTYISNWLYLKSTTDTTYDQSDNTKYNISTTSYTFNTNKHLATTKTADSEKREVLTTFRYPYDFAPAKGTNGSMGKLVTKNILSTHIEELAWLDGKLVAGKVKDYDEFSGLLLPKSESILEINSPVAATAPVNADPAIPFTGFNKKINFVSYYKDNLLQYSEEGNISKSYIWGYNDQFPIAEAVNAASNQIAYTSFEVAEELGGWTLTGTNKVYDNEGKTGIKSYKGDLIKSSLPLGTYIVTLLAKGSGDIYVNNILKTLKPGWNYYEWELTITSPEVKIINNGSKIDEVRLHPKYSQMSTYIYDPLFGITSTTSPNNTSTFYEYDKAGRLHLIKDQKGNIVKQLDYNYQAR